MAFWDGVRTRMGAIGDNRLSKDHGVALRRAIHKIIPWPMEADRKRLEVLKLGHDYWNVDYWRNVNEGRIVRNEDHIKKLTEENERMRTENTKSAELLLEIASEMASLGSQLFWFGHCRRKRHTSAHENLAIVFPHSLDVCAISKPAIHSRRFEPWHQQSAAPVVAARQ